MKRVFGIVEVVFNLFYLSAGIILGIILVSKEPLEMRRLLAGLMAFVLVAGDAFHLIPRIWVIITQQEKRFRRSLGRGKQIASITMTVFYLFLWQIGFLIFSVDQSGFWTLIIYILALIRIALCLFPQNEWEARQTPLKWGIWRNIPFFIMGMIVAGHFWVNSTVMLGFGWMWLAILLSFAFYLPVVLWVNRNPKIGMLMLPKSCTYLWMLVMCLSL